MVKKIFLFSLCHVVLFSCATSNKLVDEKHDGTSSSEVKNITHRMFVLGGAEVGSSSNVLDAVALQLQKETSDKKYLLLTGDHIKAKKNDTILTANQLDQYIKLANKGATKTYLLPGNKDWDLNNTEGLEFIEDYLEDNLEEEDVLSPNNGCPLESIDLDEGIQLITIDSQWYIQDWDKHPDMNDKCEIKSREKFISELEGEFKKNANKVIILAMHHPLYTNGEYGGKFSSRDHIFPYGGNIPLPGLASIITQIRAQGAPSKQDRFSSNYRELADHIIDILDNPELRTFVVSGHEKNLQFIEDGLVKQMISGAIGQTTPASLGKNGVFSYGSNGYASIDISEERDVNVTFFKIGADGSSEVLFQKKILDAPIEPEVVQYPKTFPKTMKASVYEPEMVEKSDFFKSVWGKHYREVYGTQVEAPVANLETLYGGLEVVRAGGGHQTQSLRLITKDGKEYNMRALRKSATQFLETVAFKDIDGEEYFSNTTTESLIADFYTAAHPYAAFAVPEIAKAADVYYTTPSLYYVPKQERLGKFNEDYGDKLYMIVERPTGDYKNRKNFGYPDDIESTDDLINKLRKDEDYILDERAYIRARIFDMLLGDWDRHSDQWRWAVFENEDGKKVFEPIPRDRDQVFANFDGALLKTLGSFMSSTKQFGVYGPDIEDVKWFNKAGIKLDRALVKRSDRSVWIEEAKFLQNAIDKNTLDKAFGALPEEVQDATLEEIKQHFIGRQANLVDIVNRYYDVLDDFQMLTGTDKDDHFEITRLPNGVTTIKAHRIKDDEKSDLIFDRTFTSAETGQIWLYGLDDKDVFEVKGKGDHKVLIRIIGGHEKDVFDINEGRRIKVYDSNSMPNEKKNKGGAHFRFTDFYEANLYDYQREPTTSSSFGAFGGYNPDDGINMEAKYSKERIDFIANPYGQRFALNLKYSFLTQGVDGRVEKTLSAVFKDFNLLFDGRITSDQYTENFFGFGNETINNDDDFGIDFNRVQMSRYNGGIGIERESEYGSFLQFKVDLNTISFKPFSANANPNLESTFSERTFYLKPNVTYRYQNYDDTYFTSRGMLFSINGGVIDALNSNNLTPYVNSNITFYNSLTANHRLVLKTNAATQLNFGDAPAFFQRARLGANTGLRGYRAERFTGDKSLAGTADLMYNFKKIKTTFFPIDLMMYGGVDIGRVWLDNENSDRWHSSYGGGLQAIYASAFKARVSLFNSSEGTRFMAGLSFGY